MASHIEPGDDIIKLRVTKHDGDTETLNIHRGVLCKSSEFFQRATKPEWTGLREQPGFIDLSDDSVKIVSDYIRWLYCDHMPVQLYKATQDTRAKKAEEAGKVFLTLAEAYVFGEKIVDAKYKNAVVKTVIAAIESSQWNLGPDSVNIIYKGTPPKSPLRRLFADSVACMAFDDSKGGVGWIQFIDGYPREALADAMKATIRARPEPTLSTYRNISLYLEEEKKEGEGAREEE